MILGHHYQRDEVIKFADYTGDSLKLARAAASRGKAEFIVFCGVHFMAESADILRAPHQKVVLPDLAAGCSMADMAAPDQLEMCWRELKEMGVDTPARRARRRRSRHLHQLVSGDQSLRRRARRHRLHVDERRGGDDVGVGARREAADAARSASRPQHRLQDGRAARPDGRVGSERDLGGLDAGAASKHAKLILWKGHCSVHTRFTVAADRGVPEAASARQGDRASRSARSTSCRRRTRADRPNASSTSCARARSAASGRSRTEVHLVNRLTHEVAPDRTVVTLDPFGCLCSTMFRVSPNHLLWMLESLVDGKVHNQIIVPEPEKSWARLALDRMLAM